MHLPLRERPLAGYLTGDLTCVLFVAILSWRRRRPTPGPDGHLVGNGGVNYLTVCSAWWVVAAHSRAHPVGGLWSAGIFGLAGHDVPATTDSACAGGRGGGWFGCGGTAPPLKLILVAIAVAVPLCLALGGHALVRLRCKRAEALNMATLSLDVS